MERTREMHIAERERRMAVLNGLMEENDLAVMVCHGNGAMAYQADVKYMTDLATPCGHMFSMMVRGGTAHCPAGACRCRLPCPTEDLSGRGPCGYHTGYGGRNLP